MIRVIPLSTNLGSIDLRVIRDITKQGLDVEISTRIKDEREPLIVLSKYRDCSQGDTEAQNNAWQIYKHVHFSFMILSKMETQIELMSVLEGVKTTTVQMSNYTYVSVVSASLDIWLEIIKSYSVDETDPDVLSVLNQLQEFFEVRGLSFLFSDVIKRANKYGFRLEHR